MQNARIVGVIYLKQHAKCLKCGLKVVGSCEDDEIGKCTSCYLMQCLDACDYNLSGKLIIKSSTSEPVTLIATMSEILRG
jgi:hypothetical protein